MKLFFCPAILLISFISISFPQEQHTIMSYNLLNYPGSDSSIRNPYFRTVISNTLPDILVVQEMISQAGMNGFLNNVLNVASSGYAAGTFIDGPDTDNGIFYKTDSFTFLANNIITTDLRNISEFKLVENSSGDTIRIYSLHLKASTGSSNEQQRLAEVNVLRSVTNALPSGSFFLVLGDFNIYSSNEPAYSALINQSNPGYFIDLFNLPGIWNNPDFAQYHTQSPRTRQFGGGATGGMDDRFDMILFSQSIINTGGIHYIDNSYINYGNDGLHYNDSINKPPNQAVDQVVANALHYSSDHLPIMINLSFESASTTQFSVDINNGWNLLSVPLLAPDMTASVLFPTAISPFYTYSNNIYNIVTVLENGKGYWAKFDGLQSTTITGTIVNSNEISVNQGWNIIGPFSITVPVSSITTIPPNIITSSFFGFNVVYYATDILEPGKGYWIKTNSQGTIQFNIIH